MIRGQAGQIAEAEMISATTGAVFVGTVTCYVTIDTGPQTLGSVGSGICTSKGNGLYQYLPSAAETAGALVTFTFVGSGAVAASVQYPTITVSQQSALNVATGPNVITAQTLVLDALQELGIPGMGQTAASDDQQFALRKLNRLLDNWNADRRAVYASQFTQFTLVPGLLPHTLGPSSATWTVSQRPVSIDGANLILNTTNSPQVPITMREAEWYQGLSVPTLQTSIPTDLYYEPDWPNGSLFFYPVPTVGYAVQLQTRLVLAQLGLFDTFSLPPGYRDALALTLAEDCASAFGRPADQGLVIKAMQARARIFANNDVTPRLRTWDAGMPGGRRPGSAGNYLNGWQSD